MVPESNESNADIDSSSMSATPPTPLLCLPDELLGEITVHVMEFALDRFLASRGLVRLRKSFYTWLPVTHVCQQWRNVALSTPRLWCNIRLINVECVEEFLSRSRSAPLQFYGAAHHLYSPTRSMAQAQLLENMLQLVLSELHRIEIIHHLPLSLPLFVNPALELPDSPDAPLLQALSVNSIGSCDIDIVPGLSTAPLLQLTSLAVRGNSNGPGLVKRLCRSTITTLRLSFHRAPDDGDDGMSLLNCVELLREVPMLQQFSCDDLRDPATLRTIHDGRFAVGPFHTASLPHLHTLFFDGSDGVSYLTNAALLLHLDLRKTPSVFFCMRSPGAEPSQIQETFATLSRVLQRQTGVHSGSPIFAGCVITHQPKMGDWETFMVHLVPTILAKQCWPNGSVSPSLLPDRTDFGLADRDFGLKISGWRVIEESRSDLLEMLLKSPFVFATIPELRICTDFDSISREKVTTSLIINAFVGVQVLVLDTAQWPQQFFDKLNDMLEGTSPVLAELQTLKLELNNARWRWHFSYQHACRRPVHPDLTEPVHWDHHIAGQLTDVLRKWGSYTGKTLDSLIITSRHPYSQQNLQALRSSGLVKNVVYNLDEEMPSICVSCDHYGF